MQNITSEQFGEKLIQRNLLRFKDPLGFSKTVFIKTTYFEDDLVKYFFEHQGEQTCQTIKHFNKEDPVKIFGNKKTTFISGKILHKDKYEDFALEKLEEKAISVWTAGKYNWSSRCFLLRGKFRTENW